MSADERKQRLQALRERAKKVKATQPDGSDGEGSKAGAALKFRNYRPIDAKLLEKADLSAAKVGPAVADAGDDQSNETGQKSEEEKKSMLQQELERAQAERNSSELNIAPKKPNWDLKRDLEEKLAKLNRQTQRAIVEIVRQNLEEAANEQSSESGSEESGDENDGLDNENGDAGDDDDDDDDDDVDE